jgi:NAD(P)-dependent dehydrogenase (short-subunit alcohol dehydrogenase family)
MSKTLENKVAIITGANQGLGFEISRKYVDAGANLMICARNSALLETVRDDLMSRAMPGQIVVAKVADVSQEADVAGLVADTVEHFGRLDILVNNAGVYGPKGAIEDIDWREWVSAIEINLFGSILMCRAVIPHFKAAGRGKIIQLSGGGATSPMPMISAYAASKAGIVRFIETIAGELRDHHIDVNAIAPGALNTRMLDEILAAGPEKVGQAYYERCLKQRDSGGAPMENAAQLAVFLGGFLSDGITGKLISAVWDPWEDLPQHLDELNATDIYTLRRIVPKDRGMGWGD